MPHQRGRLPWPWCPRYPWRGEGPVQYLRSSLSPSQEWVLNSALALAWVLRRLTRRRFWWQLTPIPPLNIRPAWRLLLQLLLMEYLSFLLKPKGSVQLSRQDQLSILPGGRSWRYYVLEHNSQNITQEIVLKNCNWEIMVFHLHKPSSKWRQNVHLGKTQEIDEFIK